MHGRAWERVGRRVLPARRFIDGTGLAKFCRTIERKFGPRPPGGRVGTVESRLAMEEHAHASSDFRGVPECLGRLGVRDGLGPGYSRRSPAPSGLRGARILWHGLWLRELRRAEDLLRVLFAVWAGL